MNSSEEQSQTYTGPFGHRDVNQLIKTDDVEGLVAALTYPKVISSHELRTRIVHALGKLESAQAVEPVSKILVEDEHPATRRLAAIALGRIGDPTGSPALRKALTDSDTANQQWAIRSLGLLRDRESVEFLIAKLGSDHAGIRQFAARALGEIGDQRATLPLVDRLSDRNRGVRRAAAEGMVLLGDSRAIDPLKKAYSEAGLLSRRPLGAALRQLEARFS